MVGVEIHRPYCQTNGIEINRRLTGGGAILFDPTQIGWEVICSVKDLPVPRTYEAITDWICQGPVWALNRLGVPAAFRPRNDIEVRGRKISGTGGVFEEEALLFQGTLLVDFDAEAMVRALQIPLQKITDKQIASARERVTCLKELLNPVPPVEEIKAAIAEACSKVYGVGFEPGGLTEEEERLSTDHLAEFRSPEWVYRITESERVEAESLRAVLKLKGGLIRVSVKVDLARRMIQAVLFTGDFFIHPRRTLLDLEASLKNIPFDAVKETVYQFFQKHKTDMLLLKPDDFYQAIEKALNRLVYYQF
jgi:lipoate-protein ligase A